MELTFGTGFVCPECKQEATYTHGFWATFTVGLLMGHMLNRLNKEGGQMTSETCGHTWKIAPGTRK